MRRGIDMESKAKEAYKRIMKVSHSNVTFKECRLVMLGGVLGASPDMLVKCDCHGQGVVEINYYCILMFLSNCKKITQFTKLSEV